MLAKVLNTSKRAPPKAMVSETLLKVKEKVKVNTKAKTREKAVVPAD